MTVLLFSSLGIGIVRFWSRPVVYLAFPCKSAAYFFGDVVVSENRC